MQYEPWNRPLGEYRLCKYNKRLYIAVGDTLVYTLPDFLILDSRSQLQYLVDRANARGMLVIEDIIVFESRCRRPRGYAQQTRKLDWELL